MHKIFWKAFWGHCITYWWRGSLPLFLLPWPPFPTNLFLVGNLYIHVQWRTDKMTQNCFFSVMLWTALHSSQRCANISTAGPCSPSYLLAFSYFPYLDSGADGLACLPRDVSILERDSTFPFSRHHQSPWESLLEIPSPGFGDGKASSSWILTSSGRHPHFLCNPQFPQWFFIAWEVTLADLHG